MGLLEKYVQEEVISVIIVILYFILKAFFQKLVRKYAVTHENLEQRTNLVIKYINIMLVALALLAFFIVWGVKAEHLFVTLSSVFAVIGVALFAQWSILTNITSGVLLFFSYPFKIGDTIRINDKDFPTEAKIEDIRSFYIYLRTADDEMVVYPNSLILQKGVSIINTQKSVSSASEFED